MPLYINQKQKTYRLQIQNNMHISQVTLHHSSQQSHITSYHCALLPNNTNSWLILQSFQSYSKHQKSYLEKRLLLACFIPKIRPLNHYITHPNKFCTESEKSQAFQMHPRNQLVLQIKGEKSTAIQHLSSNLILLIAIPFHQGKQS